MTMTALDHCRVRVASWSGREIVVEKIMMKGCPTIDRKVVYQYKIDGMEEGRIIPVDCISSIIGEKIQRMQMRTTGVGCSLYPLSAILAQYCRRINQDGKLNRPITHHETQTSLAPSQKSNLQVDWSAPARIRQFLDLFVRPFPQMHDHGILCMKPVWCVVGYRGLQGWIYSLDLACSPLLFYSLRPCFWLSLPIKTILTFRDMGCFLMFTFVDY